MIKTFLVDKKRKGGIDEIAKAVAPLDDITMHDFDQFDERLLLTKSNEFVREIERLLNKLK